jgi:hypothetical protein
MAADDRGDLADGVEHLQAAARELIRAGRSLLDAAEGLVEDPAALRGVLGSLGSLAQAAAGRVRADAAGGGEDEGDGGVERIPVS